MALANRELRKTARAADIPFWRIAAHIGISEASMTRWLRVPLDEEREKQIIMAIKELSKEGE